MKKTKQSSFVSANPATGNLIKQYPEHRWRQVHHILDRANVGVGISQEMGLEQRCHSLNKIGDLLLQQQRYFAELITIEIGKPIVQAMAEIEKCAWVCRYYAEYATDYLQPQIVVTDYQESIVYPEPMGVVLAVMPWNFPFWQVFRFAAAAIVAGNAVVLKHAPNVPQCTMAIQQLFDDAGFPSEVFQHLLVSHSKMRWVVESYKIDAITFTGSVAIGSKIGEIAGRANKKTVMELGGSDAFIVLSDADLKESARIAVQSRMLNSGQSCIAAKRFIVMEDVARDFIGEVIYQVKQLKVGDPMDESTDVGPLARPDLLVRMEEQLRLSQRMGAKIIVGGKRLETGDIPAEESPYFAPTIVLHTDRDMPLLQEEIFGPIMPIVTVRNESEAIQIANDTPYGLGASIWTNNIERAKKMSNYLRVGTVFINGMVVSNPMLPFGGVKHSGYGTELGKEGLFTFTYPKVMVVQ